MTKWIIVYLRLKCVIHVAYSLLPCTATSSVNPAMFSKWMGFPVCGSTTIDKAKLGYNPDISWRAHCGIPFYEPYYSDGVSRLFRRIVRIIFRHSLLYRRPRHPSWCFAPVTGDTNTCSTPRQYRWNRPAIIEQQSKPETPELKRVRTICLELKSTQSDSGDHLLTWIICTCKGQ